MSTQPKTFLTEAEYLEIERRAEFRSDYLDGEMFAMAGGSRQHSLIGTNIIRELSEQLIGRPCEVHSKDLRLRVTPTGLYTYPDVMVCCEDAQFADDEKDTLLSPILIVEILSQSTRNYDRYWKLDHYRRLPSLLECLMVVQNSPLVHHWTRQPENRWLFAEVDGLQQAVQLASIGCVLSLAKMYDKVQF